MGYLPNSKIGDCTCCASKNTECRKRGKDLICLSCCKKIDTKKQVQKANERNAVRKLVAYSKEVNPEFYEQTALEKWFKTIAMEQSDVIKGCKCWECGEWIPFTYMRAATAHVIPKSLFPSVRTHSNNFIILGAGCGCHQKYDRSWDDASKMKIFPEAKKRFQTFVSNIALEERRRLPECLISNYIEVEK